MILNPEFKRQESFISQINKIQKNKEIKKKIKSKTLISVDCCINNKIAQLIKKASVDILVCVRYPFLDPNYSKNIQLLKK